MTSYSRLTGTRESGTRSILAYVCISSGVELPLKLHRPRYITLLPPAIVRFALMPFFDVVKDECDDVNQGEVDVAGHGDLSVGRLRD